MNDVPARVLSDAVRHGLSGRRVTAAVFTTYTLEPEFFEREIATLLAGDSLVQEPKLRLVQLEKDLRGEIGPVAVYYDANGLRVDGSKWLDIRFVPVRITTGCFHPKLVVLLTEPTDPGGLLTPSLICGVLSANLTKSGWWSSLECAHFEVIEAGAACSFRDDLLKALGDIRRRSGKTPDDHAALDRIRTWLLRETSSTAQATTDDRLRTRLIAGNTSLVDFLAEVRGAELAGCSLEVISPFFDARKATVLRELVDRFALREARISLPTADDGSALVDEALYDDVRKTERCDWARIPRQLLALGGHKNAKLRGVHAKVYRFTKRSQGFEALVVGSHNLSSAALHTGGNFEASFLVERENPGRLDWWLEVDGRRPAAFEVVSDDETHDDAAHVPLEIAYNWETDVAEACWRGKGLSPTLVVESARVALFEIDAIPTNVWMRLPPAATSELRRVLVSSSVVEVATDDQDRRAAILVQEYGMAGKPSVLVTFTVTEILEFWSRLTPEQQAAFLTAREESLPEGFLLQLERASKLGTAKSFFETYAGIFHGFEMLRRQIVTAIRDKKEAQAHWLLLGNRHDSLPHLIDRVIENVDAQEAIPRYLQLLSARQLLRDLRRLEEPFFVARRVEISELVRKTESVDSVRAELNLGGDGPAFLEWFEKQFLRNLAPVEEPLNA